MKKLRKYLILISLLLPISSATAGEWDSSDTLATGTWLTLHAMDYNQTNRIINSCKHGKAYSGKRFEEANLLLGRCPSKVKLRNAALATGVGYAAISYYLPKKSRPMWYAVTIGLKAATVMRNKRLGLSFSF